MRDRLQPESAEEKLRPRVPLIDIPSNGFKHVLIEGEVKRLAVLSRSKARFTRLGATVYRLVNHQHERIEWPSCDWSSEWCHGKLLWMQYPEFSMPFLSEEPSLLRQSRFWLLQFAGWTLIQLLYYSDAIEWAARVASAPAAVVLTVTNCVMSMACSSVLAVVYIWMPPRWLNGVRAMPIVLGLSLLAALPWTTAMNLVAQATSMPSEWLPEFGLPCLRNALTLMLFWSVAFLCFMLSKRVEKAQAQVEEAQAHAIRCEAIALKDTPSESERPDSGPAATRGAGPSSAPESRAVPWRPGDRVGLQERKRVRFCLVQDIAYIQAAGEYTEVHLSSGQVAFVTQGLRYWESQLPESFVRIHRSTLINLELTEELVHLDGAWRVRVRGCPEPLTVSRRLEAAVRAKAIGQNGRFST